MSTLLAMFANAIKFQTLAGDGAFNILAGDFWNFCVEHFDVVDCAATFANKVVVWFGVAIEAAYTFAKA